MTVDWLRGRDPRISSAETMTGLKTTLTGIAPSAARELDAICVRRDLLSGPGHRDADCR